MKKRYVQHRGGRGKIHIYDGEAIKCGLPYSKKYKEVEIEDGYLSNKYNNKHKICKACRPRPSHRAAFGPRRGKTKKLA